MWRIPLKPAGRLSVFVTQSPEFRVFFKWVQLGLIIVRRWQERALLQLIKVDPIFFLPNLSKPFVNRGEPVAR